MSKGTLFIISGPSGSGKDTVLAEVFKRCPELDFSISVITRPMRNGETADGKYRFVSTEAFEQMIKNGELLEHNIFVGNYYGTPKKYVEDHLSTGRDVIVEVDVNGAAQIREKMPDAVSIFICPPSLEILKERLEKRGTDGTLTVEKRLSAALGEIKRAVEYDYIVINDLLDNAVENTVSIIRSEKSRTEKNTGFIDGITNK